MGRAKVHERCGAGIARDGSCRGHEGPHLSFIDRPAVNTLVNNTTNLAFLFNTNRHIMRGKKLNIILYTNIIMLQCSFTMA